MSPVDSEPRRRAHYEAAHEAILSAAAAVLAEKPWATMAEIAERSGLHRSTSASSGP